MLARRLPFGMSTKRAPAIAASTRILICSNDSIFQELHRLEVTWLHRELPATSFFDM